jgi:hypothetical protein
VTRIPKVDLAVSRLAERAPATNAVAVQEISIVSVSSHDGRARSWRITLGRLERVDQHAAVPSGTASVPVFPSQQFAYTNGELFDVPAPSIPPFRANPVLGGFAIGPGSATSCFVELAWGMTAASPNRLLADWPAQGSSLVVTGAYVQVAGAVQIINNGAITPDVVPVFSSMIVPTEGQSTEDNGELSISQESPVLVADNLGTNPKTGGQALFVPDFARRLRVVGVDALRRVPTAGAHTISIVFYDDRGQVCDAALQNATSGTPWLVVPGRAVLVAFYMDPAEAVPFRVLAHWRIAP